MKIAITKTEAKTMVTPWHRILEKLQQEFGKEVTVLEKLSWMTDSEADVDAGFAEIEANPFTNEWISATVVDDLLVIDISGELLTDTMNATEGMIMDIIDFAASNKFKIIVAFGAVYVAVKKVKTVFDDAIQDIKKPFIDFMEGSLKRRYDGLRTKYKIDAPDPTEDVSEDKVG